MASSISRGPMKSGRFARRSSIRRPGSKTRLPKTGSKSHCVSWTPDDPQYLALRRAFAEYRAQAASELADRARERPARTGAEEQERRDDCAAVDGVRRLYRTRDQDRRDGDEPPPICRTPEALQRRQHGLTDDGIVSAPVVTEMNVSVDRRMGQIALNLERWRWLPRDLGERHIVVNIPEYRLEVGAEPGSADHARRRRQAGHADADLQRRPDPYRVQPLLERAAHHRRR